LTDLAKTELDVHPERKQSD